MTRVKMSAALRAQILREADAAAPRECCGILEGWHADGGYEVTALHPARNLSSDPARFAMDPKDQFAAQRCARANRAAIIGCYHSHPGGQATPSAADRAGAAENHFLWLIAGTDGLKAFVYRDGDFGWVTGADWVTSSE